MQLEPLGDSAVTVTLGTGIDENTLAAVLAFAQALTAAKPPGISDVVAAYATVTVFYDPHFFVGPGADPYQEVCAFITSCAGYFERPSAPRVAQVVEIPVCYASTFAPDLEEVAAHARMSVADVVGLHSGADYLVYAIGFTPGFPYLGGLPEALAIPRRSTPRTHVPAGSVAIGGQQTGIYPVDSPGGWHIIGRTPLPIFRPAADPAALLRPGDRVRFKPIWATEFASWK